MKRFFKNTGEKIMDKFFSRPGESLTSKTNGNQHIDQLLQELVIF